jgi:hypothetical protein
MTPLFGAASGSYSALIESESKEKFGRSGIFSASLKGYHLIIKLYNNLNANLNIDVAGALGHPYLYARDSDCPI